MSVRNFDNFITQTARGGRAQALHRDKHLESDKDMETVVAGAIRHGLAYAPHLQQALTQDLTPGPAPTGPQGPGGMGGTSPRRGNSPTQNRGPKPPRDKGNK